jgi:hypothetical protein
MDRRPLLRADAVPATVVKGTPRPVRKAGHVQSVLARDPTTDKVQISYFFLHHNRNGPPVDQDIEPVSITRVVVVLNDETPMVTLTHAMFGMLNETKQCKFYAVACEGWVAHGTTTITLSNLQDPQSEMFDYRTSFVGPDGVVDEVTDVFCDDHAHVASRFYLFVEEETGSEVAEIRQTYPHITPESIRASVVRKQPLLGPDKPLVDIVPVTTPFGQLITVLHQEPSVKIDTVPYGNSKAYIPDPNHPKNNVEALMAAAVRAVYVRVPAVAPSQICIAAKNRIPPAQGSWSLSLRLTIVHSHPVN